jgi:regulatory protein
VWHKNGAMPARKLNRARPALNGATLEELALRYVGRFATTRAKLIYYLERKLRERGWDGEKEPDAEALAGRMVRLGYVDDAAYALSKSRALAGRGYGPQRIRQSLRAAGVGFEDSQPADDLAQAERVSAALRFARRRRLGPFAERRLERDERERALAAMVRAGHAFALARAVLELEPGSEFDLETLFETR